MKFFRKLKDGFLRFMYGRYGTDALGNFMLWTYIGLWAVNIFVNSLIIYAVSLVILIMTVFRMFSRNISARNKENVKFLSIKAKVKSFFKFRFDKIRDMRKKVYKKCPSCKAVVRLPRKGGKHFAVCPACKKRFSLRILPFAAIISLLVLILAAVTAAVILAVIFL